VKRRAGVAFVQSGQDAVESVMPERAAEALNGSLDGALSAEALGVKMAPLIGAAGSRRERSSGREARAGDAARRGPGHRGAVEAGSTAAPQCPECSGSLWSLHEGRLRRYRCDSLLSTQGRAIEQALWAAIKGRAALAGGAQLSRDEVVRRRPRAAQNFRGRGLAATPSRPDQHPPHVSSLEQMAYDVVPMDW
jgi:hypothetical protein